MGIAEDGDGGVDCVVVRPRVGEEEDEDDTGEEVGLDEALELAEELEPELELEEGRTPDRPSPYSTALAIQSTTCAV